MRVKHNVREISFKYINCIIVCNLAVVKKLCLSYDSSINHKSKIFRTSHQTSLFCFHHYSISILFTKLKAWFSHSCKDFAISHFFHRSKLKIHFKIKQPIVLIFCIFISRMCKRLDLQQFIRPSHVTINFIKCKPNLKRHHVATENTFASQYDFWSFLSHFFNQIIFPSHFHETN